MYFALIKWRKYTLLIETEQITNYKQMVDGHRKCRSRHPIFNKHLTVTEETQH